MCYIRRRKGKAIEAATLRGLKLHRYKRRAVTTSDSGGYFLLSFKIWYVRLIRATTNVQNKKKSWYVIIAIPSFPLWSGGFTPPWWRVAALALWFSHADNIPYFSGPDKSKAGLTQLGGLIRHNLFRNGRSGIQGLAKMIEPAYDILIISLNFPAEQI